MAHSKASKGFASATRRFESSRPSQAVQSRRYIFPIAENRRGSRGLGWQAAVSAQKFLAFRASGRGFRAPVSARFFPIPVSGEGETGSTVARDRFEERPLGNRVRRRNGASRGRLFCLKITLAVSTRDRAKPLAGSHQARASFASKAQELTATVKMQSELALLFGP